MKYNAIYNFSLIIIILILTLLIILKSRINIIFTIDINNSNFFIKLNIKYFFNLLNIKLQIYPPKNKKNKNRKINKKNEKENVKKIKLKLLFREFFSIYKLSKETMVKELYSNISFGNKNIYFTSFIYLFINIIYANLSNIISPQKMYLNVRPNYIEDYIKGNIRIHINPRISDLFKLTISLIKINRKNKDGGNHESNRFNTKSYGNNS